MCCVCAFLLFFSLHYYEFRLVSSSLISASMFSFLSWTFSELLDGMKVCVRSASSILLSSKPNSILPMIQI